MKRSREVFLNPLNVLIIVIALTISQGCYNYRVSAFHADPGTEFKEKTVHSLFWGLVQKDTVLFASNCDSLDIKGLAEVNVTTNFGYAVITVATLGIWCPMKVKWKCGKPCPREGVIE